MGKRLTDAEKVVLVDEKDREIGTEEKIKAHREGKLHRAFSVLILNSKDEMLLQKRAKGKYHSGSLWANACCGHPRLNEETEKAAERRLKEEMGIDCKVKEIFNFTYKIRLGNGLFENEYDHVFLGRFDGKPKPDKEEAEDWKWISIEELKKNINTNPDNYAYWFKKIVEKIGLEIKL